MTPVIIWTRAQEHWQADQALWGEVPVWRLPCVRQQPLAGATVAASLAALDLERWPVWVAGVTSAYTITSLAVRISLLQRCRVCYSVGAITNKHLAAAGCVAHHPPGVTDARSLAEFLCQQYAGAKDTAIFLPGAVQRAYDLAAHLSGAGLHALRLDTYQTQTGMWDAQGLAITDSEALTALQALPQAVVCLASPTAVQGFCLTLRTCGLEPLYQRWQYVAIGPTTAAACAGFGLKPVQAACTTLKSLALKAQELQTKPCPG